MREKVDYWEGRRPGIIFMT